MRKTTKIIINNTQTKPLSGFTLVELIVVVTILSILSTIGFVSYSSYLSGVRDTNRISQLKAIGDSLHLYETKKSLPLPDEKRLEIKDGATTIAIQGYVGKSVIETIGYTSQGLDPKDNIHYSYYLTSSRKYFQLLAYLEEDPDLSFERKHKLGIREILGKELDYENRYPYVYGKKLGILTTDRNEPIQEIHSGSLDISNVGTSKNYKSYLKTKEIITGNGTIFKDLGKLVKGGGRGYSASGNTIVYKNLDGNNTTNTNINDWRSVDTNCDIADIKIGTQVWAGCNSTIGNGLEWGKRDNGSNGTIGYCYKNHSEINGNNSSDCAIGSSYMLSTTKSNTWFTGTNSNGDRAPANIWGKLYTWDNAKNTACTNGYHLPSDQEWTILENYLAGRTCRTGGGFQCDGLGWKGYTNKISNTNLVQELKIPIAGYRHYNGFSFYHRGSYTYLWSSTNNSLARGIGFHRNHSAEQRNSRHKNFAFSVRCIKD